MLLRKVSISLRRHTSFSQNNEDLDCKVLSAVDNLHANVFYVTLKRLGAKDSAKAAVICKTWSFSCSSVAVPLLARAVILVSFPYYFLPHSLISPRMQRICPNPGFFHFMLYKTDSPLGAFFQLLQKLCNQPPLTYL
ncbi:hypothetical protein KI387_041202, partial [Taxus chinensis]